MQTFYLICTPGLEKLSQSEVLEKYPQVKLIKSEYGGFEVQASLEDAFSMNHNLKSIIRVLLRLQSFKVRDLPKLYQKLQKIEWNEYLLNAAYEVKISCSKSRLNNESKVKKAFEDSLKTYFKGHNPKKSDISYSHKVYLRIFEDLCDVSIDSSGEALYKRESDNKWIGSAPIRSNIAYALIYSMKDLFRKESIVVDPFCGSGTFLKEVMDFAKPLERDFAFQKFSFLLKKPIELTKLNLQSLPYQKLIANDIDEKAIKNLEHNLKKNLNPAELEAYNLDVLSFLTNLQKEHNKEDIIVVSNPPYGERIKSSKKDFQKWLEAIQQSAATYLLLTLANSNLSSNVKSTDLVFLNGGLKVKAIQFPKNT